VDALAGAVWQSAGVDAAVDCVAEKHARAANGGRTN